MATPAPVPAETQPALVEDPFKVIFSNEHGVQFDRPENAGIKYAGHTCQIFDVPQVLFERKWLGADECWLELTCKGPEHAKAALDSFTEAFAKVELKATIKIADDTSGAITITNLQFEKKIDPFPVMSLQPLVLCARPNKIHNVSQQYRVVRLCEDNEITTALADEASKLLNDQKCVLRTVQQFKSYTGLGIIPENFSTKGIEAFTKLEKVRKEFDVIAKTPLSQIAHIDICLICNRILSVATGPKEVQPQPDPSMAPPVSKVADAEQEAAAAKQAADMMSQTPADLSKLEDKIAKLNERLQAASGQKFKQKRKKLQRELKELKAIHERMSSSAGKQAANASMPMAPRTEAEMMSELLNDLRIHYHSSTAPGFVSGGGVAAAAPAPQEEDGDVEDGTDLLPEDD